MKRLVPGMNCLYPGDQDRGKDRPAQAPDIQSAKYNTPYTPSLWIKKYLQLYSFKNPLCQK